MATQVPVPMSTLFQFHKLNERGIERAKEIAEAFNALLNKLYPLCEEGRELSLVRTKLEEASFFAKKSMANAPNNQQI